MLCLSKSGAAVARRARRARAFTVSEMMVAVFIFAFMVLGVIYTMLFGMRFDEIVCSKMGASELARMSFDQLTTDIRSAKWWKIGTCPMGGTIPTTNAAAFVACTNAMDQVGNAVRLSCSGDTNSPAYVTYYFDTNACQLYRASNGLATAQIIAQFLTNSSGNSMKFTAQQYNGNLAQDWQYKYMIVANLEFMQYQYPLTKVGSNYYFSYYAIQVKAASHSPN
jgi:type II secretory pathway pseudopilin PulG